MTEMKRCKQCGEIKSETLFRSYYGGRKGTYTTCLTCEKINNRYKYLSGKVEESLTPREHVEIGKIKQLYAVLEASNLKTPVRKSTRNSDALPDIDRLLELHSTALKEPQLYSEATLPDELYLWLHRDLSDFEPDYLQGVADKLIGQYRPVVGLDADANPIHDDTYRVVLNTILGRFDDYEDEYYNRDDDE